MKTISGSGLGSLFKKKPTEFQQNKDTLISTSQAVVVDVVCESQIERIRQIYIDGTPVFDVNGQNTAFPSVGFEIKYGLPGEELLSNRTGNSVPRSVGVEVKNAELPVIRQYVNENVDKFIVSTRWTLQTRNDSGIYGENCLYRISVKSGTGAFVTVVERNIGGLFSSPIEIQDEIIVNNQNGVVDTFQIKLEKLSPDSTDENALTRKMEWFSTAEIVTDKISYENSTVVQISLPASLYQNDVKREYEVDGMIFQIPSNATVDLNDGGLVFTGIWNGTLYTPVHACSDPVWQMLGILTNDFYSIGDELGVSDINIADLYKISVYNNEFIPDGKGGLERRYLCLATINNVLNAEELLKKFCGHFDAKFYSFGGQLRFWQDRPNSLVVGLITNSDVQNAEFTYGFSGTESKSTLYNVVWNNPLIDFQRDIEPVPYKKGINKKGIIKQEVETFGCYRVSQAIRTGRRAIYDNWLNTKTINFVCRAKGIFYLPGQILEISDNNRLKFRNSGLVRAATINSVTLDSPVIIEANKVYTIAVSIPGGEIEERTIVNGVGSHSVINIATALTGIPESETTWVLKSGTGSTEKYLIIDAILDKKMQVEIIGILYDPNKWNFIENNLTISNDPSYNSKPPETVEKPSNLTVTLETHGLDSLALLANWDKAATPFVVNYLFQYTRDEINWFDSITTNSNTYQFENPTEGLYVFRVASVDILNRISDWVTSDKLFYTQSNVGMDLNNPYMWEY